MRNGGPWGPPFVVLGLVCSVGSLGRPGGHFPQMRISCLNSSFGVTGTM